MMYKQTSRILILILQIIVVVQLQDLVSGDYIPAKLHGFVYENQSFNFDTDILIEAFYDPLCPYSSYSWPPLKQALHHYASRVSFLLHLLPLPFHDNAYDVSRALHVVNALNRSATFPLLESFFKYQEKFYGDSTRNLIVKFAANVLGSSYYTSIKNGFNNRISDIQTRVSFKEKFYDAATQNLSKASIGEEIVKFATNVAGSSYYTSIKNDFNDTISDFQTRLSWRNAVLRGVYGTPFFYVNGFLLPTQVSAYNYSTWREIIDPRLVEKQA